MSKIEDSVIAKIQQRAEAGQKKYGVTMERGDLTRREWLLHAQEEAMDLAVYLEKLIQEDDNDGWMEITEDNMPSMDELVWLWDGRKMWPGGRRDDSEGWFWSEVGTCLRFDGEKWLGDWISDDDYTPTHWKRLPMPPRKTK